MPPSRLDNYLKTYRKRSGLSQSEIAFLLGRKSAAQVSRYEQRRSVPSLFTALACSAMLGVPPEELFAGLQQKAAAAVARQIEKLLLAPKRGEKHSRVTAGDQRKLHWLNECKGRIRRQADSAQ